MLFQKEKNKGKKQEDQLRDYFETGLVQPYQTTPDDEALCEACQAVTVFLRNDSPRVVRMTVLTNAGRLVGGMRRSADRNMILSILQKCCEVPDGETVKLTAKEAKFIYEMLPD